MPSCSRSSNVAPARPATSEPPTCSTPMAPVVTPSARRSAVSRGSRPQALNRGWWIRSAVGSAWRSRRRAPPVTGHAPASRVRIESTGFEEEEVDLPQLGRRPDEIEKAPTRKRRKSEQHQTARESKVEGAVAYVTEETVEQLRRAGLADLLAQQSPHLRLPRRVDRDLLQGAIDVRSVGPAPDHLRTVEVIAVEEVGDRPHPRESGRSGSQPRELPQFAGILEVLEHAEQGPHHPVDVPTVRLVGPGWQPGRVVRRVPG